MAERHNYEDSCRFLQREGWLKEGDLPDLPKRMPRYDDELLGVEFFRTWIGDTKLDNLTLPRTYFSRTQIERCSFVGTDLSESTANWNNFEDVDLSLADLSGSDLRGCWFVRTTFKGASLVDADLRCCTLEKCDFTGADVTRLKLLKANAAILFLSPEQEQVVDWHETDGEEPDGG